MSQTTTPRSKYIKKVDHVTYACAKGQIEKWAWFHIEVEGGVLVNRIDDVKPDDPNSSMKLWCIDYGTFGVALIEGIDRNKKSQVTAFVDKHGDHACQHVAYDTHNLDSFLNHVKQFNAKPRGDVLIKNDGFGILKQMFAKGYSDSDPAEASFPEYVERPTGKALEEAKVTVTKAAGKGFYDQIEDAREANDTEPFIDFSRMPSDWKVPEPEIPTSKQD